MSLTLGQGPLSAHPQFTNYTIDGPAHRILFEASEKRVRVEFAGEIVADTRAARLLHETGALPIYYLPRRDVLFACLNGTSHVTTCEFKGCASYFDVRVNVRTASDAAWTFSEPTDAMGILRDYVAFDLQKIDAIYEEDEALLGYPHDPYHRVDTMKSSRHVRVLSNGEVIAETTRPRGVFETNAPAQFYLPMDDVRMHRLRRNEKRAICPYKGVASYWSVIHGPENAAWGYDEPLPEGTGLARHLCFDRSIVTVEVDGETIR